MPRPWVVAVLALSACSGLLSAHDTESDARRALEALGARGTRVAAGGEVATFSRLTISEVAVEAGPQPAVLFHAIGTGTWRGAALGYYGGERVVLHRFAKGMLPQGPWLPKLQGVLAALAARDQALRDRDAAALTRLAMPDYRDGAITALDLPGLLAKPGGATVGVVGTFSVRVDGDRAEVTRLPDSDAGAVRASSLRRSGDVWRFSSGLL